MTFARVGDKIGAFVNEPVQASGGVVMRRRLSQRIRGSNNDILYVSDEVVTAFGQPCLCLGRRVGIDPAVTFAKGVTSGYFAR